MITIDKCRLPSLFRVWDCNRWSGQCNWTFPMADNFLNLVSFVMDSVCKICSHIQMGSEIRIFYWLQWFTLCNWFSFQLLLFQLCCIIFLLQYKLHETLPNTYPMIWTCLIIFTKVSLVSTFCNACCIKSIYL